jgi:hypothetical protein
MEDLPGGEQKEPEQRRPAWSVLAGEFDLQNHAMNGILVARMADEFWFAPSGTDGQRNLQARELVLRAYELCGIDRPIIAAKITQTILDLKDYAKQIDLTELTPELNIDNSEVGTDITPESSPSPVMSALRALIELSNNVESIVLHDRLRTEKEKWLVDGDTRRQAEAALRSLYLEEKSLNETDAVE